MSMPSRPIDADLSRPASPDISNGAAAKLDSGDADAETEQLLLAVLAGTRRSAPDTQTLKTERRLLRRIPMTASGLLPPPRRFQRRARPGSLSLAPRGPTPAEQDAAFPGPAGHPPASAPARPHSIQCPIRSQACRGEPPSVEEEPLAPAHDGGDGGGLAIPRGAAAS